MHQIVDKKCVVYCYNLGSIALFISREDDKNNYFKVSSKRSDE